MESCRHPSIFEVLTLAVDGVLSQLLSFLPGPGGPGAQAALESHAFSWGVRTGLQTPQPDRAAASARPGGSRQVAGTDELAVPAHPCAPRHRDILSNGCNASSGYSPCPRAPSLDAAHQFTLSISRPVPIAVELCGSSPVSKTRG